MILEKIVKYRDFFRFCVLIKILTNMRVFLNIVKYRDFFRFLDSGKKV